MEQKQENFRYSLNGLWKFHYANNYHSTIPGFESMDYCCRSWDDIHVPAHIQMEDMTVLSMSMCSTPGRAGKSWSQVRSLHGLILWQVT